MEPLVLICKQCKWKGLHDEVDWDTVETCMGTDKIYSTNMPVMS